VVCCTYFDISLPFISVHTHPSAYFKRHSTETALLRIHDYLVNDIDSQNISCVFVVYANYDEYLLAYKTDIPIATFILHSNSAIAILYISIFLSPKYNAFNAFNHSYLAFLLPTPEMLLLFLNPFVTQD